MNPEQKMWLSVLALALNEFVSGNRAISIVNRIRAERAAAWIASEDYAEGSFVWICDHLDLDAATLRRRLKRCRMVAAVPSIQRLNPIETLARTG